LWASQSVADLLGFKQEKFLSSAVTLSSRIHPHDADIASLLFSAQAEPRSGSFNIRLRHADGRIRIFKGIYSKQAGPDGELILDLTLQDAKSLYLDSGAITGIATFRATMENAEDYLYFKDRNHVFTGASQTLVTLTAAAQHWTDLLGKTDYDLFPEELADNYYRLEKQVFSGSPLAHEFQETLTRDGKKGWVDNRKYPIRDDNGEIVGLWGIARDITDRKRSARARPAWLRPRPMRI
jgi:PAS domain S-box-containing protein